MKTKRFIQSGLTSAATKLLGILILSGLTSAATRLGAQTPLEFVMQTMAGSTNDEVLNIQAVNNPVIWNGIYYWLPQNGTNIQTTNGIGYVSLIPGQYTVSIVGLPQSWSMGVTNSLTLVNAANLPQRLTFYSGVNSVVGGANVTVVQSPPGTFTVSSTGGGSGAGTITNGAATIAPGVQTLGPTILISTNYDAYGSAAAAIADIMGLPAWANAVNATTNTESSVTYGNVTVTASLAFHALLDNTGPSSGTYGQYLKALGSATYQWSNDAGGLTNLPGGNVVGAVPQATNATYAQTATNAITFNGVPPGGYVTNFPGIILFSNKVAWLGSGYANPPHWTNFPTSTTAGLQELQEMFPYNTNQSVGNGLEIGLASGEVIPGDNSFTNWVTLSNSTAIFGLGQNPMDCILRYSGPGFSLNQVTNSPSYQGSQGNQAVGTGIGVLWVTNNPQFTPPGVPNNGYPNLNNFSFKNFTLQLSTTNFCVGIAGLANIMHIYNWACVGPHYFTSVPNSGNAAPIRYDTEAWLNNSQIPYAPNLIAVSVSVGQMETIGGPMTFVNDEFSTGFEVPGNSWLDLGDLCYTAYVGHYTNGYGSAYPTTSIYSQGAGYLIDGFIVGAMVDKAASTGNNIGVAVTEDATGVAIKNAQYQQDNHQLALDDANGAQVSEESGTLNFQTAYLLTNSDAAGEWGVDANLTDAKYTAFNIGSGASQASYSFFGLLDVGFNFQIGNTTWFQMGLLGKLSGNGSGLTNSPSNLSILTPNSLVGSNQVALIVQAASIQMTNVAQGCFAAISNAFLNASFFSSVTVQPGYSNVCGWPGALIAVTTAASPPTTSSPSNLVMVAFSTPMPSNCLITLNRVGMAPGTAVLTANAGSWTPYWPQGGILPVTNCFLQNSATTLVGNESAQFALQVWP